jgi:cytoskeleton protein RodZ
MDMNEQRKAAASGAGDGSSDPAMTGQDMTAGADAAVAGDSPPAAAGAAEEAAATVASAPALISPGALLARAREQYGLSVGEIASQMKLAPRQVEALEADAWDRLPSMLFVRGFIKGYARCVHADPAPALAALEVRCGTAASQERASTEQAIARAAQPSTAIPFPSSDQPSRRLHRIAAALAVLCIGFLAFEWFGPTLQSVQGVVESDRARAVAAPGAVAQPESAPQGAAEGALLPAVPAPQPAGTAPGATAPAVVPLPAGAPPAAAAGNAQGSGPGERTIRLAFDRESWVEIRDARGKLIFSQLNPPGTSQVVQGEPPLSLVVGNAGSVRLAYNDREIDLKQFNNRGDVARFTLE